MADAQTLRGSGEGWDWKTTKGVLNLIKSLDFYPLDKQGDNSMKVSTHLVWPTVWKAGTVLPFRT